HRELWCAKADPTNSPPLHLPRRAAHWLRIRPGQSIGPRPREILLHGHIHRGLNLFLILPNHGLSGQLHVFLVPQRPPLIGAQSPANLLLHLRIIKRPHVPVLFLLELHDVKPIAHVDRRRRCLADVQRISSLFHRLKSLRQAAPLDPRRLGDGLLTFFALVHHPPTLIVTPRRIVVVIGGQLRKILASPGPLEQFFSRLQSGLASGLLLGADEDRPEAHARLFRKELSHVHIVKPPHVIAGNLHPRLDAVLEVNQNHVGLILLLHLLL